MHHHPRTAPAPTLPRTLPHWALCGLFSLNLALPATTNSATADTTATTAASATTATDTPGPGDEVAARFATSLQRINKAGNVLGLAKTDPDLAPNSQLWQQAMGMDAATASPAARHSAAQWLLLRSQKRGLKPAKNQTFLQAANSEPDLLRAFALLEAPLPEAEQRQRALLRLTLALTLRDPAKIALAYPELAGKPELTQDELALCLMAAAHLGQWADLQRHADAFKARGGDIKTLHDRADRDLTVFDYESVLAAVASLQPGVPAVLPGATSYEMKNRRARVKSITGSNTNLVRQLQKVTPEDWIDKPLSEFPMMQVGAVVHWAETATHPPVSGLLLSDRLLLKGYRIAPNSNQSQTWDMKPMAGKPGRWQGSNTVLFYRKHGTPGSPVEAQMEVEEEWDLQPVAAAAPATAPAAAK